MVLHFIEIIKHFLITDTAGVLGRFMIYYQISDFDRRIIQLVYTIGMLLYDIFEPPTAWLNWEI